MMAVTMVGAIIVVDVIMMMTIVRRSSRWDGDGSFRDGGDGGRKEW